MNILLNHSPSVAMPSNLLTYKKKGMKSSYIKIKHRFARYFNKH